MARLGRHPEEQRERGEVHPLRATAEQVARQRNGVDHRCREPLPGQPLQLAVDEADVEARVVGDEHRVPGEGTEPPQRGSDPGRPPQHLVRQAGDPADRRRQRHPGATSVSNVCVGSRRSTRTPPISQIRADAAARPVVSRSNTTNSPPRGAATGSRRAPPTTRARRAGHPGRSAGRATTERAPRGPARRRAAAAPPRPRAPVRRALPRTRPADRANRTPAASTRLYEHMFVLRGQRPFASAALSSRTTIRLPSMRTTDDQASLVVPWCPRMPRCSSSRGPTHSADDLGAVSR